MVSRRTENTDVTESFITYINTENEWAPGTETTDNTSVTARPGALTFDYKVQFDVGPIELSSTADGLLSKVWRVRRNDYDFWISRENDEGDDWREEELLFSIDEETQLPNEFPSQFGFSFDQNGRPVLTFALNGTVFLWWFDPQESEQVIREIGPGRTPVILLDDKRQFNIPNSDLLLFYLTDLNELIYLRQRDRYNDVFSTPVEASENSNLELLYKSIDNRLVCVYTEYDSSKQIYNLGLLTSVLYPAEEDDTAQITFSDIFRASLVRTKYEDVTQINSSDIISANLRELLVEMTANPDDGNITFADVISASIRDVLIERTANPDDGDITSADVTSVSLREVLLELDADPDEGSIQSTDIYTINLEEPA